MNLLLKVVSFLLLIGLSIVPAPAAQVFWAGADSDPFGGTTWIANPPLAGDVAIINNGTTAALAAPYDPALVNLWISYAGGNGGIDISGTGSTVMTGSYVVGAYRSTGTHTQSGGSLTSGGYLYLGHTAGATGIFNQTGGTATFGDTLRVGYAADTKGELTISGGVLQTSMFSGPNMAIAYSGSSGKLTQTGGAINITAIYYVGYQGTGMNVQSAGTVNVGGNVSIGGGESGGTSAYGYYKLSGTGTITAQGYSNSTGQGAFYVGQYANGLYEQTGGTVSNAYRIIVGGNIEGSTTSASAFGVYNMTAGVGNFNKTGGNSVIGSRGGTGVLNLSGGQITIGGNSSMYVGYDTNGKGIVNLGAVGSGGGVLATNRLLKHSATGTLGLVNFHGGTLRARSNQGNFLEATTNYVYGEGANIDTDSYAITIATALAAPAGNGVVAPTVNNPGAGYTSPPIVKITGASGTGATAIAVLNLDGTLNSIVMTNPGTGYSATTAATFTLVGGNPTTPATLNPASRTANVSGGLTKLGAGTLTLSATNTYTGATSVNEGQLIVTGSIATSSGITVAGNAALGGITAAAQPATTVNSLGIVSPGNGATTGTLTISGLTVGNNAILRPVVSATAASLLQVNGNITASGGASDLIVNLSAPPSPLAAWTLLNYTGSMTGTVNVKPAVDSLGTVSVATAWNGSNVEATFADLTLGNQWNNAAGGDYTVTTNWSGAVAPDGTNQQALLGSAGGGTVNLNAGLTGDLDLSSLIIDGATAYTLSTDAGKKLNLQSALAADAQITVTQGSHAIAVDIITPSTNPRINVNDAAAVLTVSGKLSGSGNWIKTGAGTLALTNAGNDYAGATILNGGTLEVSSLANGGSVSSIGQSSAAPENLVLTGTLRYTGGNAVIDRGFTLRGYDPAADQASTIETDADLTFSGRINSLGLSSLVKTGAGTLSFTNSGSDNILTHADIYVRQGKVILNGGAASVYTMRPDASAQSSYLVVGDGTDAAEMEINSGSLIVDGSTFVGYDNGTGNVESKLTVNNAKLDTWYLHMGYSSTAGANNGKATLIVSGDSQIVSNTTAVIGETAGNSAAVFQSGGSVFVHDSAYLANQAPTTTGPIVTSDGYYQLSNGILKTGGVLEVGIRGGGLFEQTGGTREVGSSLWVGGHYSTSTTGGYENAFGVYNLSGGTASAEFTNHTSKSGIGGGAGGGVMNVTGTGHFSCYSTDSDDMFAIGGYTANDRAILNLGAVATPANPAGGGGLFSSTTALRQLTIGSLSTSLINFHGGTLQALSPNNAGTANPVNAPNFLEGTTVTIYSEGANIDTNGTNITITNALQPPTGEGLTSITVDNGGSGYVSPPVVEITSTGGVGVGASANAVISGGVVTGFTITNPGSGYVTGTDVLTVKLRGGGGTSAAGTVVLAANTTTGGLDKLGAGTLTLSGTNTYTGATTIHAGALAADEGTGLPTASFLSLDGGVLESIYGSFTRPLSTSGAAFQWTANGGGFSAGASAFNVNVGGASGTLTWGSTVGSEIVGTLKFGSRTSANVTIFENGIDLNGATRTINVEDNTATNMDYTVLTGVVSNSTGTAGLSKTGDGTLVLAAFAGSTYNGDTVISSGALQANDGAGLPNGSFLVLDGGVLQSDGYSGVIFTRGIAASGANKLLWTANGGGFSAGYGTMNVQIGGNANAVNWGNAPADVGSRIVGTLKFGSTTAGNVTTFENAINLNGGNRTIQVDDNASSTTDYADLIGVIANGSAAGGIVKSGAGTLRLSNVANSYTGPTIMAGGTLEVVKLADAGSPSSIGAASVDAANLVVNGVLRYGYTGQPGTITDAVTNRGLTVRSAATIDTGPNLTTVGSRPTSMTFGGPIVCEAVSFTKVGAGRLTFTNNGTNTLTVTETNLINGTLKFDGGSGSVYDVGKLDTAIETIASDAALLVASGTVKGTKVGTAGDFWRMGGAVAGGYAYWNLSGGSTTMDMGYFMPVIGYVGTGVFDQTGGVSTSVYRWYIGDTGGLGVYNISGGASYADTTNLSYHTYIGVAANSKGIVNISGTGLFSTYADAFCRSSSAAEGIINLGAIGGGSPTDGTNGVHATRQVYLYTAAGKGTLNFHGGTLQARANSTAFIRNTATDATLNVYVYGEGAVIDSNGFDITIAKDLQTPAAAGTRGLTGIALSDGGSGYIGAPAVQILGGTGTGATAIASVDLDPASANFGKVTGFTITNPGTGYTEGDGAYVTLSGGGTFTTATVGSLSWNAGNVSGGLTKIGLGILTLSGTNTYTGQVKVKAGALATATVNDGVAGPLGNSVLPVILGDTGGVTGALRYTGATASSPRKFTMATGGTGEFDVSSAAANLTLSGLIDGNGNLSKIGSGSLILSTANSYLGSTTISAGSLDLATSGQIATSSSIVNNAIFRIIDGIHTVNAISGTGSTRVNGTSVLTAPSIVQNSLTIGGSSAAAVPEPSALALLALAGLALAGACLRRK
ncbi:MAG: autotransporter-associated beta strand repeat-containing protein [Pirellulales bacterium]|nr:autotransporter-associated beta strand repeat-containing protein [Pirellulales bacterium]